MRIVAFLAVGLLVATGCRDEQLIDASGDLAFEARTLDLGETWVGKQISAHAILHNRGRADLDVTWEVPGAPWELVGLPRTLSAGQLEVPVRLRTEVAGDYEAVLTVVSGRSHRASITLRARVLPIPVCAPSSPCVTARFDVDTETCVEAPLPDGMSCDPGTVCMTDATCQAGRCLGTEVVCNDGNACTLDTCNAITGCEFLPAPPCPGDGKCQVGVCDPQSGCGLAPASDGTVCGQLACDSAEICIGGACVVRDPPDGFVCAEPSPCQGMGVCQNDACVQPPKTALQPNWVFDSATQPVPTRLHDFVLRPDGELSLMGFYSRSVLRVNTAAPVELPHTSRRCIDWNGHLVCADYRHTGVDGDVTLLDPQTGSVIWAFNLGMARPDFAGISNNLFLARVTSLGSDRIAAIYEAYPLNSDSDTQCRLYFLAILDVTGRLVAAQRLTDPMLDICNHPHPYGMASDTAGNLYVSISGSSTGSAPLAPQEGTLFASFNRDGVLRWKHTDSLQLGGELAVSRGLLFPERALRPMNAATGQPVPGSVKDSPSRFELGRVVVNDTMYVTSPEVHPFNGDRYLRAFARSGAPKWTAQLPTGDMFISRELRAVEWTPPRPGAVTQTAVLTFARRSGVGSLMAHRMNDGAELWSCPVQAPIMDAPQLFETTRNGFAVMGGAITCGECDPPFANSAASFWTFEVPGLDTARISWTGTFGGPGHDHREDVVVGNGPAN